MSYLAETLSAINVCAVALLWLFIRTHVANRVKAHAEEYGKLDAKIQRLPDLLTLEKELNAVQAEIERRTFERNEQYKAESAAYHRVWRQLVRFYLSFVKATVPNVTLAVDEPRLELQRERQELKHAKISLLHTVELYRPFCSVEIAELLLDVVEAVQADGIEFEAGDNRTKQQQEAQTLLRIEPLYLALGEAIRHRLTGGRVALDARGSRTGIMLIADELAWEAVGQQS